MSNIIGLVGGASGKELTLQIQKKGYEVALVAGDSKDYGLNEANYSTVTDLLNSEKIYRWLKELSVDCVIIGTGHRYAFALAAFLQEKGMQININLVASNRAKEKKEFKDFISSKGYNTPDYISIKSKKMYPPVEKIVKKIGLPCVVKATIDTMLPQKANTVAELDAEIATTLESGSPAIVEQFIKGIDITVFVSMNRNKARALPVCYYSKAEDNNMIGFSHEEYIHKHLSPDYEERVMRYCERLAIDCAFEGLPRIDLMVVPDGDIYVLEANSVGVTGIHPRHSAYCKGTVLYLKGIGIDVAEIVVENALQKFGLL